MSLNFPTSPAINSEYSFGNKTWVWNGSSWFLKQNQPNTLLELIKTVDGAGSGLDADTLDSQSGSYYLDYNSITNKPSVWAGRFSLMGA
jgi:hypothetical protein